MTILAQNEFVGRAPPRIAYNVSLSQRRDEEKDGRKRQGQDTTNFLFYPTYEILDESVLTCIGYPAIFGASRILTKM